MSVREDLDALVQRFRAEALVERGRREEVARLDLAWWFVSFTRDGAWKGAIVVRAFGPLDALHEATLRGEALPGEIKYVRLASDPPPSAINRLLSEHEVRAYFGEALAVRP